jgi:ketosteroid isomerase-like protein
MSQENVEIARELFDAVARQNLSRLIELTDPEVEWQSFFALGEEGGVYRGHSGIERYVGDLNDAWEIVHPHIDDSVGVGTVMLIIGRVHYRGRESGAETESPAGWILKFRNGKVLLFRAFREPERTLEATGLSE